MISENTNTTAANFTAESSRICSAAFGNNAQVHAKVHSAWVHTDGFVSLVFLLAERSAHIFNMAW